jgi:MOSC domain-containing protein YiiM
MGQIYSIVYQPVGMAYGEDREDYLRLPLQEAVLVAGRGLDGDQKAGRHPDRQLNILSYEWLQSLEPQGYRTAPGQFGEQLIVQGLPLMDLQPGQRLQLGDQAVIELTKARTVCDRLERAQRGKPVVGRLGPLGMLAKVVRGGHIRVGDPVAVLALGVGSLGT